MTVEQLYQSLRLTCSGNDAELIAFNPDAADNTRVCSLTQRAQSMTRHTQRERENTLIKRSHGINRAVSNTTTEGKGKYSKRKRKGGKLR